MTTCSDFKYAQLGDLHLAHPNNPPEEMIPLLKGIFPKDNETAKLDAIIITGDIYDHQLTLPDLRVNVIDEWIIWMLRQCKAMDIALWIVRGTPSHDRDQSARFVMLNETLKIGCDLTYEDELKIVWMPRFKVNVLFVPDEWTDDANKTLEEVHQLLRIAGIKKVDYAVMHGQFKYQLPEVVKAQKHDEESYLAIVDKTIAIGHVHQFSRYGGIIAAGSFDRMTHGDEAAKGHVRVTVRGRDDFDIVFVENTGAKTFVTIDCKGLELEDSHAKIQSVVPDLRDDSFVRIVAYSGDPILTSVKSYEEKYPYYRWASLGKPKDEKSFTEQAELLQSKTEYIPIEINAKNVETLVMDIMLSRNIDMATIKLAESKLKELL